MPLSVSFSFPASQVWNIQRTLECIKLREGACIITSRSQVSRNFSHNVNGQAEGSFPPSLSLSLSLPSLLGLFVRRVKALHYDEIEGGRENAGDSCYYTTEYRYIVKLCRKGVLCVFSENFATLHYTASIYDSRIDHRRQETIDDSQPSQLTYLHGSVADANSSSSRISLSLSLYLSHSPRNPSFLSRINRQISGS